MKKIVKQVLILSFVSCSIVYTSCSDSLLDEKLHSQLGASSLPKGEDGANQLVLGIYPKLQPNNYILNYAMYGSDAISDQVWTNWGGIPETAWGGQMHFLSYDANHTCSTDPWWYSYNLIAQCNEALRLFKEEAQTNEKVKVIIAEATFWRAYFYNHLVRLYGDVPLVQGGEDMSNGLSRNGKDEVVQFMIDELSSIEDVLPATRPSEEYGRPTCWAVKAFLANVYLNNKDWANAAKYAKDVIDNGGFSLVPYYHDAFIDENKEAILVSCAIGVHYLGNNFDALSLESTLINGLNIQGVAGSNGFGLCVPFFESFDPKDKRREDYNPETKKGIMIHGYINNPDGTPLFKDAAGNPLKVEEHLFRIVALKYPLQENAVSGEWMTHDLALIRLAEVYLTYAEAQNELDNTGEALTYIELIRTRAGLEGLSPSLSKEQLRSAILDERGWELYAEGYRRQDLIRHNKLLDKVRLTWEHYLNTPWPYQDATYRNLLPVPSTAMIRNPLLTQNSGY